MRLIKMIGLAAAASLAAMAMIGATSASANTNTLLCKVVENPCSAANAVTTMHFAGTEGKLLNSTADVLCLNVLAQVDFLGLGTAPTPQMAHILEFTATGCGTEAPHTNCTVTSNASPTLPWLADLLRTNLEEGILKLLESEGMKPETRIKCTIFGFIKIDCTYDGSALTFETTGEEVIAEKSPASLKEGGGLCPEKASLDGTIKSLEAAHLSE